MQGLVGRINGRRAGSAWRWTRIVGAGMVMAILFVLVACGDSATPTASGARQESVTVTSRTASPTAIRQSTATTAARTASPARTTPSVVASASATRSGTAQAKTGASGGPAPGLYDCYSTADAYSTRYQTSFTLNANGTYSIDDGSGKYTYDAADARVLFTTGPYAEGGFFGDYDPNDTPTIYLKDQTTQGPGFSCQRG